MRRAWIVSVVVAAVAVTAPAAPARPPAGRAAPVPSHQPKLTHALWLRLVRARRPLVARAGCRPARAIFYAADDWLRLATKLAANASPCAQYFISIPPLAADKTSFRSAQPAQIRALGPQFHVLAEISYNGWSSWVAADPARTFHDAGLEARRRMDVQGFDVAAGDSWIVNEASSAVRANTGTSRPKIRDLLRGLYDGGSRRVKGGVFVVGLGQSTSELGTYKLNLQSWYADAGFWQDMGSYVADWAQEVYGDVRDYAVAGADAATRAGYLNDYLHHPLALAAAAPPEAATAASYLSRAYAPLGNAAWAYGSAFGFTDVPVAQMEDYVSAQVYAVREYGAARGAVDRLGFAWAPRMPDGSSWTPAFTADTAVLLDRLAAAIRASDASPAGACAPAWCAASLEGAAFTDGWKTFAAWSYPALAFTSQPLSLPAGGAAPVSVRLEQAGIAQTAAQPVTVVFSSSSPTAAFAPAADGPWTPSLAVQVPAGAGSATAYFRDGTPESPTVTATADGWQQGSQVESVTPAPAPPLSPPPSGGGGGGAVPPDLTVSLAPTAAGPLAPGAELDLTATVSTLNAGSSSDAELDVDLPSGYSLTRTYSDRGSCSVDGLRVTCDVAWISPGTATHVTLFGTVAQVTTLRFAATVTSRAEPDADGSNNGAALTLTPLPVAAEPGGTAVPLRVVRRVRVAGVPVAGRALRAVPPAWTTKPSSVRYRWEICRRSRCATVAGRTLRLRASYVGRTVRIVVRATDGRRTVTTASPRLRVRGR